MSLLPRLGARSGAMPGIIFGIALLILLAGVAIIFLNEAQYRQFKARETRIQAEILAASVAAPLDFGDPLAAQEAVDAFRANQQIRWIGIYAANGRTIAGFHPGPGGAPRTLEAVAQAPPGTIRAIVPVESSGQQVGTIHFEVQREPLTRRLARYSMLGFLFVLAALVVAVLGMAQSALRRANRELADRAEALVESNALLEVQMEEREKAEEQLRQAQKMQALGQLTGGIAHDFNNLLTVIQGSADMLARQSLPEEKRVRFANAIVQAASNAASLTSQLLAFARRQPLKPEPIDLNHLVAEMRDLLDRTLGELIRVELRLSQQCCEVEADPGQLQSAILNIAANARDAMPDGGRLTIATELTRDSEGRAMMALEIADTGTGMDQDTLERVFEPFFTTKATGRGTGLGLSQVYGFASQSGGEVAARSAPGEGTTLRLLLPCSAGEIRAAPAPAPSYAAPLDSASILVVEDNDEVGAFAETLLLELGHRVTRARSGEEALELALETRFDLVFSDVVMPGMGGLALAEELARVRPDLPVLLATGFSQQLSQSGSGGRPVILKPYRLDTLAEALRETLSRSG